MNKIKTYTPSDVDHFVTTHYNPDYVVMQWLDGIENCDKAYLVSILYNDVFVDSSSFFEFDYLEMIVRRFGNG